MDPSKKTTHAGLPVSGSRLPTTERANRWISRRIGLALVGVRKIVRLESTIANMPDPCPARPAGESDSAARRLEIMVKSYCSSEAGETPSPATQGGRGRIAKSIVLPRSHRKVRKLPIKNPSRRCPMGRVVCRNVFVASNFTQQSRTAHESRERKTIKHFDPPPPS